MIFKLNWYLFNSIDHFFQSLLRTSKPQCFSEYNQHSNNLFNIDNVLGDFWHLFIITFCMIFYHHHRSEGNEHLHTQKPWIDLTSIYHNKASFQLSNQNSCYFFSSKNVSKFERAFSQNIPCVDFFSHGTILATFISFFLLLKIETEPRTSSRLCKCLLLSYIPRLHTVPDFILRQKCSQIFHRLILNSQGSPGRQNVLSSCLSYPNTGDHRWCSTKLGCLHVFLRGFSLPFCIVQLIMSAITDTSGHSEWL